MKNNTKLTLKIYSQHLGKYKLATFVVLFSVIGGAVMNTVVPLYFKKFFDILTSGQPKSVVASGLISTLIMIAVMEGLQWLSWRISTFAAVYLQPRVMADLADTCFRYLQKHSFSFFNNSFVGSLVKQVNRFIYSFEGICDRFFWSLLNMASNVVIIIVVLTIKQPQVGMVVMVWLVIFLIVNASLTKYKLKYDIQRNDAETKASGILADAITNHVNVKLFNGYRREVKRFAKINEKVRKLREFSWNLENVFEAIQAFLMIGLEIGLFYLGIKLWKQDLFTVGDFVLLQSYVMIVFMKIWDFGRVIRNIYQNLADASDMTEILDTKHEIIDKKNAKELIVTKGKIEFKNISFNYKKNRNVVSNLNLTIKPGERVALVGPSGAGKTTVTKLLLRLHDIRQGKILIDGQEISNVTQESLWTNTSLVPQDPILFHRTLLENIKYGKSDASDEEAYKAAKLAHCDEFIKQLSEEYQTYVGERGVKLSGGERQRVAIARAILRNAPILVLDEATSSLDSVSEHLIQDALDSLMRNKTVIVIAHRLSTIMKMDRIVVIDEGGIVEQGSHEELVKKKNGIYGELWKRQVGGYVD